MHIHCLKSLGTLKKIQKFKDLESKRLRATVLKVINYKDWYLACNITNP